MSGADSSNPEAHPHPHWRHRLRETVLSTASDGALHISVVGGSDNGQFAQVGPDLNQNKVNYASGRLYPGDVIIEVQGQKVAGYTERDVLAWLHHCCRNGNPVVIKTIPSSEITKDLRQFLNTRFQKGSADHELQNTIRDNLYLRTVPVTTRTAREGEVNGVDYTFLSLDEFVALERQGNLLESGIYEGNHYGTPKPTKKSPGPVGASGGAVIDAIFPGAHPSSEGKRRRNRSNVEAMAAKNSNVDHELEASNGVDEVSNNVIIHTETNPGPPSYSKGPEPLESPRGDELGPLPVNWEKAYTERGEVYFIDHNSGTSHWLDPRLIKFQKKSLEECMDDELPYGWEKIEDPHYGTYYIDHVNRKTQYENPVIQAKRAVHGSDTASLALNDSDPLQYSPQTKQQNESPRQNGPLNLSTKRQPINQCTDEGSIEEEQKPQLNQTIVPKFAKPTLPPVQPPWNNVYSDNPSKPMYLNIPLRTLQKHQMIKADRPFFTRNPDELQGEKITTSLLKSSRGLGFTIIGGDDSEEEFLQIKSVVPQGPAWIDGKLQMGDVLVYVNTTCVLGFTHHDMVTVFQSIAPGENVTLEVCRGYPLPFDPNDPNNEVVTTVAVNAPDNSDMSIYADRDSSQYFDNDSEDMVNNSVKSVPDLCASEKMTRPMPRPSSTDMLLNNDMSNDNLSVPEFLTIPIVKGAMGFGFTIADSAYGQKVKLVKKILDRQRCKNLLEGDILVDINNINVRNMSHIEVVQVLKDCARNHEASVTVQRGGLGSPSKSKLAGRRKEENAPPPPSPPNKAAYKDVLLGMYRSKTPTADLYSTQKKEIVPNRPKTPLVDTRPRSKTPTGKWAEVDYAMNLNKSVEGVQKVGTGPQSPDSPDSMYNPYKETFTYGYVDERVEQINQHLINTSLEQNSRLEYGMRSRSPGQELDYPPNNINQYRHEAGQIDYYPSQYPGYYNGYGPSPVSPYDPMAYAYSDHKEMPQQAYHQSGLPPPGTVIPPLHSGNYYPSDSLTRRKESTSFEHEQPLPSAMSRLNRGELRWNPASQIGQAIRIYPAGPGLEWVETVSTLLRQESGFGFRIVGGTEEGSQVSIGHIVPGGAADLDGRLRTGDEIVSVDNHNVLSTSHHHVVQLMGKAAANGRVTIGVRRRVPTHELQNMNRPDIGYPFNVTVSRRENEGFGFVIISSVNKAGSTIGRIIEGSPAERCGQLHVGDRILAVNNVDIVNLHHGDIVNLIKDSGYTVTLTIGPPVDDTSSTASISQREDDAIEEYHAVELNRGKRGFGFSIRGGREFHNMPLFVLQIAENGPASLDNRLRVGDQIIEINGVNTKSMTHAEAIEIIRNGGPCVRLLIKRGVKIPPGIAEAGGASGLIRPGSSLSQPSTVPTSSGLNGPITWDHFPQS
ncbi:membrane-associated guanylate kinase, WW and PDZ domain-containing protein 1-like isoform X5 [Neocloeon triangulifer]|uniref:membrane-associated guanylate kinase, WW and PDZ domain-containing protein 1-like isoform X5 n=1 Tax=Neocloeon triangulifer TaxID=2078957 RepID=UPI00286F944D|nr:membrane-associated guanylate kinase, WW and PDZ domain-containing protein 1-like isoform X5 [Neocloeon triangulifer]